MQDLSTSPWEYSVPYGSAGNIRDEAHARCYEYGWNGSLQRVRIESFNLTFSPVLFTSY